LADFNNFLACNIKKKFHTNDFSFDHLILILLLHYLVKCRSLSLTVYNNEFILDGTRVGSEMINCIVTNPIGNYCFSKSHTYHITSFLLQHMLKMSSSMNASGRCWHYSL